MISALIEADRRIRSRWKGTILALARVEQDLLVRLEAFGLAEAIGPGLLFPVPPTAVAAYRRWAASHPPPASQHPDGDDPRSPSGTGG